MELPTMMYSGKLYRHTMSISERQAYEAFCGTKARSKKAGLPKPEFSAREFMGWWLTNLSKKNWTRPTCGRIDHSLGYSFSNIEMQEMADNSREGMLRNRTHLKTKERFSQKILVLSPKTKEVIAEIDSIREAARFFGVSQRLIQFVVRGTYKKSRKIGFDLAVKQ